MTDEQILDEFERRAMKLRDSMGTPTMDGVRVIEGVRALLAASAEPVAWQPIETAPKDGSMFLGWVDAVEYGESDEGRPFETDASDHDFCQWVRSGECGYFENMMGTVGDASHITHWMPLPNPPSKASD